MQTIPNGYYGTSFTHKKSDSVNVKAIDHVRWGKGEDMETNTSDEIIPLNIVMTYPVKWSVHTMINNFVQNFYDSLGPELFNHSFRYGFSGDELTMSADKGFSREWLYYVGASTKRSGEIMSAGFFGEGFKMAALAAVRDYDLRVEMESRDWWLRVIDIPGTIDNVQVRFLAYETGARPFEENAVLHLKNADEELFQETLNVRNMFFYEGNPYFGECLVKSETFAVYEAQKDPRETRMFGYVFASYERRAFLYHIPLVFCNHRFRLREDDRDRDTLSSSDCMECILEIVKKLNSSEALKILDHLKVVWYHTKSKGFFSFDWVSILSTLVDKILMEKSALLSFRERYRGQLIIPDTEKETPDRNRRMIAREWFERSELRSRFHMVHPIFCKLGIRTVCMLCEEYDGYTSERSPSPEEKRKLQILREAAEETLGSLLSSEPWPEARIQTNRKAPVTGYTKVRCVGKRNGNSGNQYGLQVVAAADYVYLNQDLLQKENFPAAFATYAHELLHRFGGDRTLQFHRAIMVMNELVLDHLSGFKEYERRWKQEMESC